MSLRYSSLQYVTDNLDMQKEPVNQGRVGVFKIPNWNFKHTQGSAYKIPSLCLYRSGPQLLLLQHPHHFPWPTPTEVQKAKIEQTAQGILDARALYPDSNLADLYDEVTMPPELRKAHQMNDRAVMEAYGWKASRDFTESMCVAELFKLYQELTK